MNDETNQPWAASWWNGTTAIRYWP